MHYVKRTTASLLTLSLLVAGGFALSANQPADAKKSKKHHKHHQKNLMETLRSNPDLKTYAAWMSKSGASHYLNGKGTYTVFATSEQGYSKVPKERKDELTKDNKRLKDIMKYSMVKGNVHVADLADKRSVATVQGESLMVDAKNGANAVQVDGALLTQTDIKAANGTIHVIDFIVVPERGK